MFAWRTYVSAYVRMEDRTTQVGWRARFSQVDQAGIMTEQAAFCLQVEVQDLLDGTYRVSYRIEKAGLYQMVVLFMESCQGTPASSRGRVEIYRYNTIWAVHEHRWSCAALALNGRRSASVSTGPCYLENRCLMLQNAALRIHHGEHVQGLPRDPM